MPQNHLINTTSQWASLMNEKVPLDVLFDTIITDSVAIISLLARNICDFCIPLVHFMD